VLYHSANGQAWDVAALPDGLAPSGLAASDGTLYAVGTAPGGGGVDVVIASSSDGAQTWSQARLPQPAADLEARFPNEVQVSAPVVAGGPTGLVAAVTVTASPDAARLLPADAPEHSGLQYTPTGIDLYSPVDKATLEGCAVFSESSASGPPPDSDTSSLVQKDNCQQPQPQVVKSYTWSELGLEPELQALLGGVVHVYTSADGSTFDETPETGLPRGYVAALVGSDDGYRMFLAGLQSSVAHPMFSADGRSWVASGDDITGWVRSTGRLAGNPAAVVDRNGGGTELLLAAPGGGWTTSDMGLTGPDQWVQDVAIGPLGVVAVVGGGSTRTEVVESADGHQFTRHELTELIGDDHWAMSGISMNADAVIVRLSQPSDPNAAPEDVPTAQRLLVGVPG
jgi:hypothetical protein